jgi:hypothetical protein
MRPLASEDANLSPVKIKLHIGLNCKRWRQLGVAAALNPFALVTPPSSKSRIKPPNKRDTERTEETRKFTENNKV